MKRSRHASDAGKANRITEVRRQAALLKTGALQNAILTSANFSIIATDEKGIIQIFKFGAERMLGYLAADVMNKITPADISDPQEVIARAEELSVELGTPILPGFDALVFKASRGIEDIYEPTYFRKDVPADLIYSAHRIFERCVVSRIYGSTSVRLFLLRSSPKGSRRPIPAFCRTFVRQRTDAAGTKEYLRCHLVGCRPQPFEGVFATPGAKA